MYFIVFISYCLLRFPITSSNFHLIETVQTFSFQECHKTNLFSFRTTFKYPEKNNEFVIWFCNK